MIGEKAFKLDKYIDDFLSNPGGIQYIHKFTSGGYVSGEVKPIITLRVLAGGDDMDLGSIFDIYFDWCNIIMYDILEHWIIDTSICEIDMESCLSNNDEMTRISTGSAQRSNGVLKGATGAMYVAG